MAPDSKSSMRGLSMTRGFEHTAAEPSPESPATLPSGAPPPAPELLQATNEITHSDSMTHISLLMFHLPGFTAGGVEGPRLFYSFVVLATSPLTPSGPR